MPRTFPTSHMYDACLGNPNNLISGDSKRDSADGGFNQSQGYAQSFNQIPQQPQPAYQAPQNVSAASSDFSMLSDDDPELPF